MFAKHQPHAHFIQTWDLWCDEPLPVLSAADEAVPNLQKTCSGTVPGTAIEAYTDHVHLTTAGAIYMWPHICDRMEEAGLLSSSASPVPSPVASPVPSPSPL
jgi:hypothetical protein